MSTNGNSIKREDFATPEQIERNVERLKKLGDSGRTGNLLADYDREERERIAKRREEYLAQRDAEFDARQAKRLADDSASDSSGLVLDGWICDKPAAAPVVQPAAKSGVFEFHASGEDLPLFAL